MYVSRVISCMWQTKTQTTAMLINDVRIVHLVVQYHLNVPLPPAFLANQIIRQIDVIYYVRVAYV